MHQFTVSGMTCGHCTRTVTRAIQEKDPAARVEISLREGIVRIDTTISAPAAADAIRQAGYAVRE